MTRLDDTRERLLEGGAADTVAPAPASTDVLLLPPPPDTAGVEPAHLTPEARYSAVDSQASSTSSSPAPKTPQPRNSESPEGLASHSYRAPQTSSLGRSTPAHACASGPAPKLTDPYLRTIPSSYSQSNAKYSDGVNPPPPPPPPTHTHTYIYTHTRREPNTCSGSCPCLLSAPSRTDIHQFPPIPAEKVFLSSQNGRGAMPRL